MSVPSASPPQARRSKFLRPIRLSTFLLLVLVIALLIGLYAQRLREAQLQDAIAVYRNYRTEAIIDVLDQPIALNYADGTALDDLLKEVKRTTTALKPAKPWAGIPIYVDPIGLQEAERSMNSTVRRPPSADRLALGEHLRRILEPLGLAYVVKEGFLMISSKESFDEPVGDDVAPYLQYRDVLRCARPGCGPQRPFGIAARAFSRTSSSPLQRPVAGPPRPPPPGAGRLSPFSPPILATAVARWPAPRGERSGQHRQHAHRSDCAGRPAWASPRARTWSGPGSCAGPAGLLGSRGERRHQDRQRPWPGGEGEFHQEPDDPFVPPARVGMGRTVA